LHAADFQIEDSDELRLVSVTGELDISNADALEAVGMGVQSAALGVTIDLIETSYLDSAGIRVLFSLHDRLRERGQRLAVVAAADSTIGPVLELTAFDGLGCICKSRQEAAGLLRDEAG
jgi:anti-anti-sigma factor